MSQLSPLIAAELAKDIYLVQNEVFLKVFMSSPIFSNQGSQQQHLKAEVGTRLINTRDGFGICAMGGKGYENELFLIFRGTTTENHNADWISNARIGVKFSQNGLPVHVGFDHIFTSMLPKIKEFISKNKNITMVHCVGHSLGGAVATLAADWVKSSKGGTVKLYTFGAPKPGLLLFSTNLTRKLGKKNIFRTYHATDPVPMVPLFPFLHPPLPGYGHYIPSNENILSAEAHDMVRYIDSVRTVSWPDLERRSPPYTIESGVQQWLMSKAPVSASSPKIWHWINAGLTYVLSKVLGGAVGALQLGFTGVLTLADTIALILRKGIDLSKAAGEWVMHLMRKIMQALGMKVAKSSEELTKELLESTLRRLMARTTDEAKKAIMRIN
jgi:hypothetical protein